MDFDYARCSSWRVRYYFDNDSSRQYVLLFNNDKELTKFLNRLDVTIVQMTISYRYV